MAELGHGYVQVPILSENNAITYRLSIAGSCTKSTVKAYVKFQDEDFGPQNFRDGLNLIEIDPTTNTITATKNYQLTSNHDTISMAFIEYINSIPSGRIVCLISQGRLNASQTLIDWFKSVGSTAFPEKWLIDKVEPSYSAFYVSNIKTIVKEHVLYNDGILVEDVSTPLEVVYDNIGDVGGTGFPIRIVEDESTYLSNDTGEIKRFPTEMIITPMADYKMVPGDIFLLKFQLMYDDALKAEGTTQVSVRFFNGEALIDSINIELPVGAGSPPGGAWMSFERYIVAPANSDGFTIYARKTAMVGEGGIRNVVFGEVSVDSTVDKVAEFGVNGIRMNYGNETKNMGDTIMSLHDKWTHNAGKVFAGEFREKY